MEFLNSDFIYDSMPFLPVLLAGLACIVGGTAAFIARRKYAKKVALPHTMSEREYVQLNDERMHGKPSRSYGTGGPGGA
jgi:hypothetical protein